MIERFRFASAPLLLAVLAGAFSAIAGARADSIVVGAKPVRLNPFNPFQTRVGRLEYRGGLQLSSPDKRFGGLSGLLVSADGRRLTAISDRGYWFEAKLAYDGDGVLAGIGEANIGQLRSPTGGFIRRSAERDAEALAPAAGGKGQIVSFEMRPKLWRYPTSGGTPVPLRSPTGIANAPENQGIEALTRLADGRLLALTEGAARAGGTLGWIGGERTSWSTVTWWTNEGFRPTGAATLLHGDVLVLERRVLPPGARIRLLKAAQITSGALLDGEEIARLEGMLTFDNMEGIEARLGARGELLVYLLSDDNNSFLQRTLLLMFRMGD